jgi:hypothetical protein
LEGLEFSLGTGIVALLPDQETLIHFIAQSSLEELNDLRMIIVEAESNFNGREGYLHAVHSPCAPTGCGAVPRQPTKNRDAPSKAFPRFMKPDDKRSAADKSIALLSRPVISALLKSGRMTVGLPGVP